MHTRMYIIMGKMPQEPRRPPETKHEQKTEATRRALLQAARRIFARDGFETCRIEDIAAATGHTRGAFYAHFQSKEDLFFALLEQEATRQIDRLRAALERCPKQQRLAAVRSFFVNRASDRQWVMLLIEFKLYALRHPRMRPRLAATHRRIRSSLKLETITELLPKRWSANPKSDNLRKVACEAILSGLVLETAYDPERISGAELASVLGQLFDVTLKLKG